MCQHGNTIPMPIGGRVRDIDSCIAHIVAALNAGGLQTVACCCGHGHRPGRISLEDGRELFILPSYEAGQALDRQFPTDIHGQRTGRRPPPKKGTPI